MFLLDEKSYKIISVYFILYKKIADAKSWHIRFDKVNGVIKFYKGIRYLELTYSRKEVYYEINSRIYNAIFDRINYITNKKVVLQIIIILQESELIHIILYL